MVQLVIQTTEATGSINFSYQQKFLMSAEISHVSRNFSCKQKSIKSDLTSSNSGLTADSTTRARYFRHSPPIFYNPAIAQVKDEFILTLEKGFQTEYNHNSYLIDGLFFNKNSMLTVNILKTNHSCR